MNNKFVAVELRGSLPNTLIETVVALNCLTVIIRFGFSFSTKQVGSTATSQDKNVTRKRVR